MNSFRRKHNNIVSGIGCLACDNTRNVIYTTWQGPMRIVSLLVSGNHYIQPDNFI